MKVFLKFTLVFAVILVVSAFLAPILYDFFQTFHPYKFERIFNRLVMIGTLLAAVFFVRISKGTLERFGLLWNSQSGRFFVTGVLTGLFLLGSVGVIRVLAGQATFAPDSFPWSVWAAKVLAALGTALLIGIMEEFFFRGFVFRSLLRTFGDRIVLCVLVTSAFYSIVHFIALKKIFVGSDPGFLDGLRLMTTPFVSLAKWPKFWPEAVGLFFFGLALNGAVIRSGSLYSSIGLHAGCVFFVRLDDLFMKFHTHRTLFWGSKVLYDGLVGWGFLILMGVVLWVLLTPAGRDSATGAS